MQRAAQRLLVAGTGVSAALDGLLRATACSAMSCGAPVVPWSRACPTYSTAADRHNESMSNSNEEFSASSAVPAHSLLSPELAASSSSEAFRRSSTSSFSSHSAYAQQSWQDHASSAAHNSSRRDASASSVREALVHAALRQVPCLGWSHAALTAAAQEQGLSPAVAGLVGSSDAEFVQAFNELCNRRLEAELAGMAEQLAGLRVRERVRIGVKCRLEMVAPYIDSWPRAMSLLAQPAALPRTLQQYAQVADVIWHAAGDTSTDSSWYTKRGLLVGVYTATELYMLSDCSPGYADTWAALDRRIEEVLQLGKAARQPTSLLASLGSAVAGTLAGAAQLVSQGPSALSKGGSSNSSSNSSGTKPTS